MTSIEASPVVRSGVLGATFQVEAERGLQAHERASPVFIDALRRANISVPTTTLGAIRDVPVRLVEPIGRITIELETEDSAESVTLAELVT